MTPQERFACAHAIFAYLYNTSGVKYVAEVYGENEHPSYVSEKATLYSQSPARAAGMLDGEHFSRLVEVAWERYGDEALRRAETEAT